jgi:phosphotransferase system HPr (HPr) family protein
MQELDLLIQNPTGLHARPAKIFVNTAKQFKADIRVFHGEKKANAKSLISMLTLGVESGSQIRIVVDGEDEQGALEALHGIVAAPPSQLWHKKENRISGRGWRLTFQPANS